MSTALRREESGHGLDPSPCSAGAPCCCPSVPLVAPGVRGWGWVPSVPRAGHLPCSGLLAALVHTSHPSPHPKAQMTLPEGRRLQSPLILWLRDTTEEPAPAVHALPPGYVHLSSAGSPHVLKWAAALPAITPRTQPQKKATFLCALPLPRAHLQTPLPLIG